MTRLYSPMKRAAATNSTATTKKTRFVDPADDPARFADDVDAALESTSHRRNRVRTDGYDSDSSDDGEGVVESRKHKPSNDDDVDDMFALDHDPAPPPKKKKKDEYLRLGDIEGQEFNDSASASEEDSEPEDEDDAERRKKAGMGYEMSSFNMRDEMEEGKFTEDGNYVRSVDVHAVHDKWMDGLSDREIKQARRRKRLHDKAQRDKLQAEEKELQESGGMPNLEKELLAMLKKGETVLEALQRLGVQTKRSLIPLSYPTRLISIAELNLNQRHPTPYANPPKSRKSPISRPISWPSASQTSTPRPTKSSYGLSEPLVLSTLRGLPLLPTYATNTSGTFPMALSPTRSLVPLARTR